MDKELKTIQNLRPNLSNLSKFDYAYDKEQMITQWTKQNDVAGAQQLYLTYDSADQLVSWQNNLTPARWGGFVHELTFDPAGNRAVDIYNLYGGWFQEPSVDRKEGSFNSVNALTAVAGAGPTDPPPPGPIEFPGGETDPPPPPPADTYTHDVNGNTTARIYWRGGGNTFEWDGANRLVAINYTGTSNRTELTYDGLGHRKKIVEKTGSTVTSTKQFLWDGNRIAEERDANNVVTRRYFAQGEERLGTGGGVYYYTRDHLGSIRELTDPSGATRARYDYDPFGNTTKVSGDLNLDFGYTGHYRHIASNLYLAPYRAYDPTIGRWIRRDPIGEMHHDGPNLYAYVQNRPSSAVDPLGLYSFRDLGNLWRTLGKDVDWSRPFEPLWDTAWRLEEEHMPGGHGGKHGGAFAHCVANCMFKRRAGSLFSWLAVRAANLSEYGAWDDTSPGDQIANQCGADAADGSNSCVEECKQAYPPNQN